jgi:hypothetical protein
MDQLAVSNLAEAYSRDVQSATSYSISAEPEAQLTIPLATFFKAFAAENGLGGIFQVKRYQGELGGR